jgi:hypothetical protein
MGWFPVDDQMSFHHKIVTAGNAAIGVWVRAGAWSKAHGTGGFIPLPMAKSLGSRSEIKRLVDVGLWEDVLGGFLFHNWAGYGSNETPEEEERRLREKKDAKREADRLRQQKKRERDASVTEPRDDGVTERDRAVTVTRDMGVTERDEPVDKRDSHGVTPSHARSRALAVQSQSHLGDVQETSPVPETSREIQPRTVHHSAELEYVEASAVRNVDFRKVRARITAQAGEVPDNRTVFDVITAVIDRAPHRDGDRTGLVLTSVRDDWAEHSKRIYATATA